MDLFIFLMLAGAFSVVFGLAGYYKNYTKALFKQVTSRKAQVGVDFNNPSFWISIIATVVIGFTSNYLGLTPEALSSTTFGVFLTQLLRKLWAIVFG